ncbi:MAG: ASKHA domain-containing protein [Rhodospirillaceae bacterium]|nr:ASKHA domain-containing protein [Rhodospirillaceae bacterium]
MPEALTGVKDEAVEAEAKIVFTPSGRRGTFPVGTNLLQAARDLGVDLDSVCGGRGICGRCQITISTGRFAKFGLESAAGHLSAFSANEQRYKDRRGLAEERRLGCHATVQGDLVIDVPPDSQVHKQVVRKRAEVRDITVNPAVRLHYVEVEKPDMHHPTGDFERLATALREQWGLGELESDVRILQKLQKSLREGDWKATVAIHRKERIIAIWPGFRGKAYGLAYDVGSTTVAAHLADLSTGEVVASVGVMNPQIRFGEDLMSRVSYAMMNPGGDIELTEAVREAVNRLVADAAAEAGIAADDILNATFVGNPIMHHLLLGIDPVELGGAPFALATNRAQTLWASEIGLAVNPDARVYFLPCIAGHVGADAAGVILSETPYLSDDTVLIVDVGTNAEIVLGNRERILAASSPTGPAFEGAQIVCGQRAAPGAIERVRIDPETLEARIRVIGCDLWSDEPGFDAATGDTGVTGICGSGIIEALAEMYLAGLIRPDGTIDGGLSGRTDRLQAEDRTFSYRLYRAGERDIRIYQVDVRAIQLAKAALYAGARLLMDRLRIAAPDRIVLAGAFGTHIEPKYAMILGMIPDCALDKVTSAGNAAGTGATIALLDQAARDEIERVVRGIEKVETAVEPEFQRHFVDAMALPHATADYPHLSRQVTLPARLADDGGAVAESGGRRRGRRRR